ncbi:MAG: stage VI sporulation protein D [Tuberibacillus sp.]
MSQTSGQSLQFSINESVWLRDGEIAEEILSMALEPDIIIEENPNYVSIKGALRLSGEYKPGEGEREDSTLEDYGRPSYRTLDEVTETDVGTVLMEHRFPVDITIPTGRIADIEDVYVTVETFDYHLPEKGCIQLEAEITISGLVDDARKDDETSAHEIVDVSYDPTEVTAFESYREPESSEETEPLQIEMKERPEDDTTENMFKNFFEDDEEVPVEMSMRHEETEHPASSYQPYEEQPDAVHPYLPLDTETVPVDAAYEQETEVVVETAEAEVHTKRRDENALYLTKMLTNAEDQFTRIKAYIVQDGDSLEKLSDRYEVPVTTILRRNRLDSDAISEGQVLYIPVTNKR